MVFHRAFDCVKDPYESMEKLIAMGVDRVLTSGLKAKAMGGMELIAKLQELYGEKIEILAGSGINASNALEIMKNLQKEMKELSESFPEDMEFRIAYDSTKFVKASIESIVETLFLTFLLVVFVVFIL